MEGGGELTSKKSRENKERAEFKRDKSGPLKKSTELFGFNFHHSLLVPLLTPRLK